jgi:hypothetical protein
VDAFIQNNLLWIEMQVIKEELYVLLKDSCR